MKLDLIAGARPNFMKIAPIVRAIHTARELGAELTYRLVHTGQHYDERMSDIFFKQLDIPKPHVNLGAGSGTASEQTAAIMVAYEKLISANQPDMCVVVGDVTSTMACAIVARKMGVDVAHVEAGIRSRDWTMPEEINRIVTDSISNVFFTTTREAGDNLAREGHSRSQIYLVGNTMIDTLCWSLPRLREPDFFKERDGLDEEYVVLTLHRPANVDDMDKLVSFIEAVADGSGSRPVIFPVHPRTSQRLVGIELPSNVLTVPPQPYFEFIHLVRSAKAVVTDSGGITEETTVLNIPCLTLRDNTERPETVTQGTNELLGTDPKAVGPALKRVFASEWKKGSIPEYWDGKAAERIVDALRRLEKPEG